MQGTAPLAFSIDALNRATSGQATAMMDRIVERSTWLAHRAAQARPFRNADDLAAWLDTEVRSLSRDEALHLLCAHPELSPPDPSNMTSASQSEQGRLDLLALDAVAAAELTDLNRQYSRRHGYPFIIALHEHDSLESVIAQFESRIAAEPGEELARALDQVVSVMKARLKKLTGTDRSSRELEPTTVTSANSDGEVT
ncbi:2-oxo-4-hydroxy-4-carboxy-5-ureidoimidazoline decarboxylase [Alphaproteobacteria bacterium GH1-50]|uniref:2-oxo-4-hydroxy-4-carboxy-5-ureidoimidazoline decarboxylase n=1 Tax=Kangsaoukella pontilimi TaxID=2691042 RepID=A0A7C9MJJ9_9RHOB|nr:2-oxo-4-hydroxy-4-carboxy-5-ureidoimidazoline decarboxylase [Kangsaoukella pontilimi]MXQ07835.1 2-oxo-4-hydroxy-4-carboxy-5-ureidoimidazoline decarboxylase [Kangsaoukella pontilimi]